MTIDARDLRARLRVAADAAAARAKDYKRSGDEDDFQFHAGRQAAFVTAINWLGEAEDAAAAERDANIQDEAIGEEAARLGLIGERTYCTVHEAGACYEGCPDAYGGTAVDLAAVEQLEEFARRTEVAIGGGNRHTLDGYGAYATETGALDQASGTDYSDADGGL